MTKHDLVRRIIEAKGLEIRDVDAGQEPFLYASGNWGPIYVSIKGLVSVTKPVKLMKVLTAHLAVKVAERAPELDFLAANVSGGMVPGWNLSEALEPFLGRPVPYVYVRETRKKGGQKELVTGLASNPELTAGKNVLIHEELVNFAETTTNSALALRAAGYEVTHASTILYYDNPVANAKLAEEKIEMIYLLTMPELIDIAEENEDCTPRQIAAYREFKDDPLGWQKKRGLEPVVSGGTQ